MPCCQQCCLVPGITLCPGHVPGGEAWHPELLPTEQSHGPLGSGHPSVSLWHDGEGDTSRHAMTPNYSIGLFCTCGSLTQGAKGDLHPDKQSQATQART